MTKAVRMLGLPAVAAAFLASSTTWAGKKEKDEDEVTVTLADVPPGVRATIDAESKEAEIKKIEKATKKGKTLYELEIIKGGQQYEILIATDGSVIKRKAENPGED